MYSTLLDSFAKYCVTIQKYQQQLQFMQHLIKFIETMLVSSELVYFANHEKQSVFMYF